MVCPRVVTRLAPEGPKPPGCPGGAVFIRRQVGPWPAASLEAADANGDDRLDVSDPTFLLNYLFHGTTAPPDPGPAPGACGAGPPGASLSCEAYDVCR